MARRTLSKLAFEAGIAALFLTGIGAAFLEGYKGYMRVHQAPVAASPAPDIRERQAMSVTPHGSEADPRYAPAAYAPSMVAPVSERAPVRAAVVRTPAQGNNVPRAWPQYPVLAPQISPASFTRTGPSVHPARPMPAPHGASSWQGAQPTTPYGYAPRNFPPAGKGFPPARRTIKAKSCRIGFG